MEKASRSSHALGGYGAMFPIQRETVMERVHPNGLQVRTIRGSGDIRLDFEWDEGESMAVELMQSQALQLLSHLSRQTEHGSLTNISKTDIRPGLEIVVDSYELRQLPDGSAVLRVSTVVDGRGVIIPLTFDPGAVAHLKGALNR